MTNNETDLQELLRAASAELAQNISIGNEIVANMLHLLLTRIERKEIAIATCSFGFDPRHPNRHESTVRFLFSDGIEVSWPVPAATKEGAR